VITAPAAAAVNGKLTTTADKQPRLRPLVQLLDEFVADVEAAEAARRSGRRRGPTTTLPSLDRALGGYLQRGPHIVMGNTGTGKTALVSQMVTSAKHPSLYVSCEMDALELFRRIIARVTNTHLGKLKSSDEFDELLSPDEARRLAEETIARAPHVALLDATLAYARPEYLLEAAESWKADSPHFLLGLDSLHAWVEMNPEPISEYDAINAGLTALRQLAQRLSCPVLIIAERNRLSMKEGGLNAGAGSRRIEYGAETVLSLDKKGKPDPAGVTPMELVVEKNRHGPSDRRIKLLFHGAVQRFEEPPS
jgi:replicative DNA helicase